MKPLKRVRTSEHAATACPHCGYVVDCATSLQGNIAAHPGGVTVCARCAGVSEYTPAMALVPFDPAKLDPEAAALVKKLRGLISIRKPS